MAIVDNSGTIAVMTGRPDLIGRSLMDIYGRFPQVLSRLKAKEAVIDLDGDWLRVFVPLKIGRTGIPWYVQLRVPVAKIMEGTNSLMWKQIVIFASVMLIMVFLAAMGARSITNPLTSLFEGIKKVGDNDFSHDV